MQYKKADFKNPLFSPLLDQPDPPSCLWQLGHLPDAKTRPKVVSIVGSRRCTSYGADLAFRTAKRLAEAGVLVVSGLAYGIDAQAHRGCLAGGGQTIAVLGTAIDRIYPASHRALAEEITKNGAIVSEYPPGSEARNWHFLERNRLVAGLADVLLVVEASDHSGTLTTVRQALDRNVEIFAIPGDLTRPMSVGCNLLIRDGAQVFTAPEDILGYLFPGQNFSQEVATKPSGTEYKVMRQLRQGVQDSGEVLKNLALSPSLLSQALSILELKGLIVSLGANRWGLAPPEKPKSVNMKKDFERFYDKKAKASRPISSRLC